MITKSIGRVPRATHPFAPANSRPASHSVTEQFEEASIIDVIVNNQHPEYANDGYNVGAVKFRFINSNFFRADETLNWAFPLDANISEYPLLNEIVYVVKALNRFYYFKKFNVSNRPTSQPLFGINEESQPVKTSSDNLNSFKTASSSPIKDSTAVSQKLGDYFTENKNLSRLKHIEGDVIFEGRSGQSIRFGSSWIDGRSGDFTKKPFQALKTDQSPNMLIRVGPNPQAPKSVNTPFGLTVEDINADSTSIWLTVDQHIDLQTATKSSKIEGASVQDLPQLDGNQVVINTDRFVMNAKNDRIIGFSNAGIHWTTLKDITMDSNRDHITWTNNDRSDRVQNDWTISIGSNLDESITGNIIRLSGGTHDIQAKNRISLIGSQIFIGTKNSTSEPLVLGFTLQQCLQALIQALTMQPIVLQTAAPGSPSVENPARIAALQNVLEEFIAGGKSAQILSQTNFTTRQNESVGTTRTLQNYKEG